MFTAILRELDGSSPSPFRCFCIIKFLLAYTPFQIVCRGSGSRAIRPKLVGMLMDCLA